MKFSFRATIVSALVLAGVAIAWFLETGPRRAAEHAAAAAHGDGDGGPHGDDHAPAGGA